MRHGWLYLILTLLVLSPAMAPVAQAQEPVTITYYTFSPLPDYLDELDAVVEAFEAEHPAIRVRVETATFADYFTRLQTRIAGRTAPDVFELNYENFVGYQQAGALRGLNDLIASDMSFDTQLFTESSYGVFSRNGVQYGLPESFSTVLLFYNKDLFDQAGVAYPAPDWTWDDVMDAARRLTDPAQGVWGIYQPIQFWEFYKVVAQAGGSILSEDGTRLTLDRPENVRALEWLVRKVQEGVMPTAADMSGMGDLELFQSGRLAMWPTGIWMFGSLTDLPFDWDVQVEPGDVARAHHFFANMVGISSQSQHPEAAWEWIKFLTTSRTAVEERIAAGWELPVIRDQELLAPYLEQEPPANREAVFLALEDVVVPPVIPRFNELTDRVNAQLELAAAGRLTPEQALKAAQAAADDLMD